MAHQLRCHRCSHWIGESRVPMEFLGVFQAPDDRERISEPRDTWRCKSCGWVNVFQPAAVSTWRDVEVKSSP